MFERLRSGLDQDFDPISLYPSHISEYEREIREPPLRVLLEYARTAQLPLEILVDKRMRLPGDYVTLMFLDRIRAIDGTPTRPNTKSKHHKKNTKVRK